MTAAARKGRRADPAKDEAILAAAQTLFAERGYGVSIDEIAAAAGVAKQTIYARYDGKHDLLAAVVLKTAEALVRPLAIGAAKPEAALTEFGVRFVDVVFAPGKLAMQRLIISEAATFPALAERYCVSGPQYVRDRLSAYLARASRDGELSALDPSLAAAQFLGLVIGADHLSALMGLVVPEDERRRRVRVSAAVGAFMKIYAPA